MLVFIRMNRVLIKIVRTAMRNLWRGGSVRPCPRHRSGMRLPRGTCSELSQKPARGHQCATPSQSPSQHVQGSCPRNCAGRGALPRQNSSRQEKLLCVVQYAPQEAQKKAPGPRRNRVGCQSTHPASANFTRAETS